MSPSQYNKNLPMRAIRAPSKPKLTGFEDLSSSESEENEFETQYSDVIKLLSKAPPKYSERFSNDRDFPDPSSSNDNQQSAKKAGSLHSQLRYIVEFSEGLDEVLKQRKSKYEVFRKGIPSRSEASTQDCRSSESSSRTSLNQVSDKVGGKAGSANYIDKKNIMYQPISLRGGTLATHQVLALNWMLDLFQNGANGILADQMGLGKTIQVLSVFGALEDIENTRGPHLVVCPLTTCLNWVKESKKWLPNSRVVFMPGIKEQAYEVIQKKLMTNKFDILVTSYEGISKYSNFLRTINFRILVVDEATKMKNNESRFSKIIRKIQKKNTVLLTGTPLMNNLGEVWSLLNFIMPKLFKDPALFEDYLENPDLLKHFNKQELVDMVHTAMRPLILRRLKQDTTLCLPRKKEILVKIPLSNKEKLIYSSILLRQNDYKGGLNILMQARKMCAHPYCIRGFEAEESEDFGEHIVEASSKLKVLDLLLKRLKKDGHKVLIFSQFKIVLNVIEDYCYMRDYSYYRLDGEVELEQRQESIEKFQDEQDDTFLFLLSTRAGGMGITLTESDTVILYDSDWNPQMDLQAIDRVHRIGQTKPVNVYRLVMEGTIEERIVEYQKVKLKIDYIFIEQGRQKVKQFEEVGDIAALKSQRMKDILSFGALEVFNSIKGKIFYFSKYFLTRNQKEKRRNR